MMQFSCISSLLALVATAKTAVVNSSDGVYGTSHTPNNLPWNTYNYCNAPHVISEHYEIPQPGSELVYLNLMMRHHKVLAKTLFRRTPDNLYPNENMLNPKAGWDCLDLLQFNFGDLPGGSQAVHIFHESSIPSNHPFSSLLWNGSCDVGQLTAGGLEDAIQHGKDFGSVYIDKLRFLDIINEKDLRIRTSVSDRTWQVTGGMLFGMDPSIVGKLFKLDSQPSTIDSLVPSYPCPAANQIRTQFQSVPAWTNHLDQNADLKARLDATLGTAGLDAWSVWYDHFFDTFTSRTCNGHSLPCNSTGNCISEEDADRVHKIGDFEYNYIWKAAENASDYNSLTFGVMFKELAQNFIDFKAKKEPHKARFYVGHDGSMIRLASGLGIQGPLRWPALGSEFIFEVWKTKTDDLFVRVFHEGTPATGMEWVKYDDFVQLLLKNVPDNIFERCFSQ